MRVYSLILPKETGVYEQSLQTKHWFWKRGYEVIEFEFKQLLDGEFDSILKEESEDVLFIGGVEVIREAFKIAGVTDIPNLDFPDELEEYLGRNVRIESLGLIREWERSKSEHLPVHIKPVSHKLFTGLVVKDYRDFIPLCNISNGTQLYVQDVVTMKSEWRATILRNEIINVSNYKGDPLLFPDKDVMKEALSKFKNAPIGCAMDWAVLDDGRTVLVEVNDGFALGNYGVPGHLYTAMIECRWREVLGFSDNWVGT